MIPFNRRHFGLMTLTPDARHGLSVEPAGTFEALSAAGLCKTVVTADGRVVLGVVGAVPLAPGECEVFVVSSEEQRRHARTLVAGVKEALAVIRPHFATIRTVGEDTPFLSRWFTWLGFVCEGPIRREEFGGTKMLMWRMAQ